MQLQIQLEGYKT